MGAIVNKDHGITPEGGFAVRLVNNTGSPSIKGMLVAASKTVDSAFIPQSSEFDAVGVVYDGGAADGQPCRVVLSGVADVLLEDGTGAAPGNWCHHATTDGRGDCNLAMPSGAGFVNFEEHFKEIGHCLSTVTAGTNKLARIVLHFN